MSDGLTIFFVLAFLLAYELVWLWWQDARADARLVPIGLATAQSLLITAWIVRVDVIGHPAGPSPLALFTMFMYALLPPGLVRSTLALRRQRLGVWYPRFASAMIVLLWLVTLGEAVDVLAHPLAIKAVALVIQIGNAVSLSLFQAAIIGPGSRSP